jgi:Fur family ferric uptake transcriptional regulator
MGRTDHQDATESHYSRTSRKRRHSLAERLEARGIRLTERRRVLLDILENSQHHLDAAALLDVAKKTMKIDRATVYRTLELLKKEGLVDELDLMHLHGEMHYYEARTESEHFHLACFECGRIEEVATGLFEQLKQHVAQTKGFNIVTARLEIGGYCADCATKLQRQREPQRKNEPTSAVQ